MYQLIHEISPDPELKALATKSLDLWWAFWAEEQITVLERKLARAGNFYKLRDDTQPVIIEAAERSAYPSFEAFKSAVRAARLEQKGGARHYDSLSGDRLSMFDDRSRPMINGKVINYAPDMAFQSRYISSRWDSGVITITAGRHKKVLDFTSR